MVTKGVVVIFLRPPRNMLSIKTQFQIKFNVDLDLRNDIRNSRSYKCDRRV